MSDSTTSFRLIGIVKEIEPRGRPNEEGVQNFHTIVLLTDDAPKHGHRISFYSHLRPSGGRKTGDPNPQFAMLTEAKESRARVKISGYTSKGKGHDDHPVTYWNGTKAVCECEPHEYINWTTEGTLVQDACTLCLLAKDSPIHDVEEDQEAAAEGSETLQEPPGAPIEAPEASEATEPPDVVAAAIDRLTATLCVCVAEIITPRDSKNRENLVNARAWELNLSARAMVAK